MSKVQEHEIDWYVCTADESDVEAYPGLGAAQPELEVTTPGKKSLWPGGGPR